VLLDAGDYARAKQELAIVVEQRPDDWDAQVAYGLALRGLKEFKQAKKTWEKVVDDAPRRSSARSDALYDLAILKGFFLEDVEGAKADLERYLQDAPAKHPKRQEAEQKRKELGL
jgi:tetratricopeptide (TPR) repeat protein